MAQSLRPSTVPRATPPTVAAAAPLNATAASVRRLEAEVRQLTADKKRLEDELISTQRTSGTVVASMRRTFAHSGGVTGGGDVSDRHRDAVLALEAREKEQSAEARRLAEEGRTLSESAKQIVEAQRQLEVAKAQFALEQRSGAGARAAESARVTELERKLMEADRARETFARENAALTAQMQEGLANFKSWGESRTAELLKVRQEKATLLEKVNELQSRTR